MKTLGLDLGGTKIAAAVVEDGKVLDRERCDTPRTGFEDVVDAIAGLGRRLLERNPDVVGAGIGSPGPLDYERGMVLFAPNIPGMDRAPLVPGLERRLGMPVILENDANAAGYAEHLYGAAHDLESSIYVTISTGIGGGLFIGDRLLRGAHGLAGEIGHMVVLPGGPMDGDGHLGTLESLAGGRAIAREGSYAYGIAMTTEEVFDRARRGERKALAIVDSAARYTGLGIANLVKVFDPEGFVLGGGMSLAGDFYVNRIVEAASEYLEGYARPSIRTALLGGDAGVIGAAAVALPLSR